MEGLGTAHAGPILFQFPPLDLRAVDGRAGFLARLHAFLRRLPSGPLYAVEVRNTALAHPELDAALDDAGGVPCFNVHPRVPPIAAQAARRPGTGPPVVVIRWVLHAGFGYEQAKRRYAPFDRLVDEDPASRTGIASLARRALADARPVYVIANNKAEGSAPLSLVSLAREICA